MIYLTKDTLNIEDCIVISTSDKFPLMIERGADIQIRKKNMSFVNFKNQYWHKPFIQRFMIKLKVIATVINM